jgi:hypothetical protein
LTFGFRPQCPYNYTATLKKEVLARRDDTLLPVQMIQLTQQREITPYAARMGYGLALRKFDGRDRPLAIVAPDRDSQTATALYSVFASSHGARIQMSYSSSVVKITGIALGWIGSTSASRTLPSLLYRSPGHHVEGGSLAVILVARSATRWLRL